MKATNIKKYNTLRQERLDINNYTISLLNEALHVGLIDQATLDGVQAQVMVILADLIRKYTKGESSSLKVETTQRLLMSIFYAIDAGISSFDDSQEALHSLESDNIEEIYKRGLDLLESCLTGSQELYQEVEKNKLSVQIEAYHSTINALPDFFLNYDLLYSAQDTMANIDYPLLFDDMSIQGVLYIKQYLEKLRLEDQFCRLFAPGDVNRLLYNYGRVYRINYSEALINVFEIVLNNAIYSVLSGNSEVILRISQEQFEHLQKKFMGLAHSHISSLVEEAIEILIKQLRIDQPRTQDYIRNFKSECLSRFINGLAYNCLENVILIDKEQTHQFDIVFDEGNRLDDESFRLLVDDIMDCNFTKRKTEIVRCSIYSLGDFIDILEADCFFGDEYYDLFNSLGDMELSVLARIVFIEEIRSNLMCFSLASPGAKASEMEWQIEFCNFLTSLSPDRIESIETYIKSSLQMTDAWDYLE